MSKGVQELALARNGSFGTQDKWTPFFQYQNLSWATKRKIWKDPSFLSFLDGFRVTQPILHSEGTTVQQLWHPKEDIPDGW